jgi:LysR family transcriptional regulator, benzoate and cis,cis-muconate-responsive activator of ben and cat genes
MELRHLRYFVAVAEEQNITRAAARLYVSQPPLSRQMRDLEREIGISLFNRSATAIKLTEAGRVFLVEARKILQRADEAIELSKAVANGRHGRVRVGYAASPSAELLPRILRTIQKTAPAVCVNLQDLSTQAMLRGLCDRTLDVALIVSLSPKDLEGIMFEELASYPVRVAVNRKHPFARRREVKLSEISGQPIVAFSRKEYPEYHEFLAAVFSSKERPIRIVEEYDSAVSLIAAVEAGRGVALVFPTMSLLAGRRLVLRPIKPAPSRFPLSIAHHKDGLSPAVALFIEAARKSKPIRN